MTLKKNNMMAVPSLLAGALVWGLIWYPYRVLEAAGVGGALSSLLTYLLALLPALFLFRNRREQLRKSPRLLAAIALAAGLCNVGYVLAMIHGEVVRVMLLFYLAPLWTLWFARLLLGEKASAAGYPVIALSLAGALVMLWHPGRGWPLPYTAAEWLGLGAGMAFALANVLSRKAAGVDEAVKAASVWAGVVLVAVPVTVLTERPLLALAGMDLRAWSLVVLVALTLFCVNLAVQFGLARIAANRAIVIMLSELVFAAVSAYFLAFEQIGWRDWLGGAMLVAAALCSGRLDTDASAHG
ncbi:MAG: DMT family transporter [Betaproteobacteria bacterium]